MTFAPKHFAIATLCLAAFQTHAGSVEILGAPDNWGITGLSAQGQTGVMWSGAFGQIATPGNYIVNADRTPQYIGGASGYYGYVGGLSMSLDGRYISGQVEVNSQYSQAALYDRNTGNWTALGALSNASGFANSTTGIKPQSTANNLSADGSTVVGVSYVPNGTGSTGHAVVFRNGAVTDLTPTVTSFSTAQAVSGDGSVISGYINNNTNNTRIWRWNDSTSSYSTVINPTATDPWTGTTGINVRVDALSRNGLWGAGGSVNNLAVNFSPPFSFPTNTYSQATITNALTGESSVIPFDHVIDTSAGSKDIVRNMKTTVTGVSDSGTVIGAFTECLGCSVGTVETDAWIYFASTGVSLSIDNYLAAVGLGLSPTQHVYNVFAMSADGDSLSGFMFDKATSTTSGIIIHGITAVAAVPEPGQWALIALGLPLLMVRRLRNRRAD